MGFTTRNRGVYPDKGILTSTDFVTTRKRGVF
jgi:hypothetical protein